MATYQVQATIVTPMSDDGVWQSMRTVPTFYLHAEVQGITSLDHARRIAREILGEGAHIHVADVTGRRDDEEEE